MGIISANFKLSGNTPEEIDLLNISHNGSTIKCIHSLLLWEKYHLGPLALYGFNVLLSSIISNTVVGFKTM